MRNAITVVAWVYCVDSIGDGNPESNASASSDADDTSATTDGSSMTVTSFDRWTLAVPSQDSYVSQPTQSPGSGGIVADSRSNYIGEMRLTDGGG